MYGSVSCICIVLCHVDIWFSVMYTYGSVTHNYDSLSRTRMDLRHVHVWIYVTYTHDSMS